MQGRISTINVFSGGKGSANVGGFWGPELKYAGFDNLIIVGKSKKPVYLYISDNNVEIRDASSIWDKSTFKTGVPNMQKGVRACYSCPTGCMPYMEINKGKYKGNKGEGFWINTIMGYACCFDISDSESVVESWLLTNELGLDGDYVAAGMGLNLT